jgi:sortase A
MTAGDLGRGLVEGGSEAHGGGGQRGLSVDEVLALVDRILAERGRRRHLFGWLRAPGGGSEDWLAVDAYYPSHRLVVVCVNSAEHEAIVSEQVPAHGLRLLEVRPDEVSAGRDAARALLERRIAELGAAQSHPAATPRPGVAGFDGGAGPAGAVTTPPSAEPQPDTRPRLRRGVKGRLLRDASLVLVISGLLLLADAGATLLWQEPLSAVIALIEQSNVDKRLLSYQAAPLSPLDLHALKPLRQSRQRIAFLARQEARVVKRGDAIGTISFPKLGDQYTVIQGTDDASLQRGPGHYPQTVFPGLGQTVAIAGHRTTYLAPFRRINEFGHGDKIIVTLRYARFTYYVQRVQIVTPTSWWIIQNKGYERLVLSACNPLYSAAQRIVVFARLQSEVPLGPAVAPGPTS